ncbi:YfhE family protein [Bacillus massilinigeriensis]|nr:YfhE family protein [Bacillus mediterraneensis]
MDKNLTNGRGIVSGQSGLSATQEVLYARDFKAAEKAEEKHRESVNKTGR